MQSARDKEPSTGFTLFELMVVIAVLSLVAMLIIPRLPSTSEGDLKDSARTLAATVRYLGDIAVSTKTGYRLRVNLAAGSMEVSKLLPEGEEAAVSDNLLNSMSLREGIVFEDITTSRLGKQAAGTVTLDFSPLGVEDFVLLHLKTEGSDRHYTVALYPGSGRVEVSEGYQEGLS